MNNTLNTIEMNVEYLGTKWVKGWEHNAYNVALTHNGVTEEFIWKQGLGIHKEPSLERVLEHLIKESYYYEEDIYDMYDDPEIAEKVIEQLKEEENKLNNLFSEYELEEFYSFYFED